MKVTDKQLANALVDLIESSKRSKQEVTDGFVAWLAQRSELKRIQNIIRAVDSVWIERKGVATVSIESSHKLSEKLRTSLKKIAKGAEVKESIDEDLIGGAKIRIDNRIIDGSIKGHLAQLTKTLSES